MAPLATDPLALDGAGLSVISIGKDIGLTLSTLSGALSGSSSMCGNDPVGASIGRSYDQSASELLKAFTAARNGLCNIGDGVRMSAHNYSSANAHSDISGRSQPLPVPAATDKLGVPSAPSAVGAGDSAPAGWGWVSKYLGMIWPNGDSATLRAAAGQWMAAGTSLLVTEVNAASPLSVVGAQQIPEAVPIGQTFTKSLNAATQIMTQCATMAGQLIKFAARIDAVHAAIIDLLAKICDPFTGFKEVWDVLTGEDEDEIKQIADDIRTVINNFAAEATMLAAEFAPMVREAEAVATAMGMIAGKVWDQFAEINHIATPVHEVGQLLKGLGGEVVDIVSPILEGAWKYNGVRMALDWDGYTDDVGEQVEALAPLVGLGPEGSPGVLDVWKQLGKDTVHWDMWPENPSEAAGRTFVDALTFFIPGALESKLAKVTAELDHLAGSAPRALPRPEIPAPRVEPAVEPRLPPPVEPRLPPPAEPRPLPPPVESRSVPAPSAAGSHHGPIENRPTAIPDRPAPVVPGTAPGLNHAPATHAPASEVPMAESAPPAPNLGAPMSSAARAVNDIMPRGLPSVPGGLVDQLAGIGSHGAGAVADHSGSVTGHGAGPHGSGPGEHPSGHQGTGSGGAADHSRPGGDGPGHDPNHGPSNPRDHDPRPVFTHDESGPGWERRGDVDLNPNYGEPLDRHWDFADNPVDPAGVTPDIERLMTDQKAPFGRGADGHPLTATEYAERYNSLGPEGQHYNNFPPNWGAVEKSRVWYRDLDAFSRDFGLGLDRIGGDNGKYLAVMENGQPASWESRALHVDSLHQSYYQYSLDHLPEGWKIEASEVAPGLGQPGGSIQIRILDETDTVVTIQELTDPALGILRAK